MTWTNAFDLGECTVAVVDWSGDDPVTMHSSILAKGDSASFTYAEANYILDVDSEGSVSLDGTMPNAAQVIEINVIPSYAHNYAAQLSGMALNSRATNATGFTDDAGDGLDLTTVSPPAPDPLDMSAITDARNFIGLYAVYGVAP